MHNDIDKILFPSKSNKNFEEKSLNLDSLFNPIVDLDSETTKVSVSYFFLSKDVSLDEENIFYKDTRVMAVGFCEEENLINVCFNEEDSKKYFWINLSDVHSPVVIDEVWNTSDALLHKKAIKEKWTLERNIKKG
jgi:hypothetical protein